MKWARIAYDGAVHEAVEHDGRVMLADGRLLNEEDVVWLPPVQPRTVFALALNYADHASELDFKAPTEPLVFLKGPNTFVGHRAQTKRPADVTYMHYECELAVVIGRPAPSGGKTPMNTSGVIPSPMITLSGTIWKIITGPIFA